MIIRICGLIAALCVLGNTADAGTWLSALAGSPNNLTVEDDSREVFVDADNSGSITAGDALVGYARADALQPGGDPGNSLYAVFSQTFGPITPTPGGLGGTVYSGSFIPTPLGAPGALDTILPTINGATPISAGAMIAVVDTNGAPFSSNLITDALPPLGGVLGGIGGVLDAEGSLGATFGIGAMSDFFAFQTSELGGGSGLPDFVTGGIGLTEGVLTSLQLGNFGAGLSVIDNPFAGTAFYNRVIPSIFNGIGAGNLYDLAVVNGNFGGINQGGGPADLVQNATPGANHLNFINNADLVVNATVVPEPASLLGFAAIGIAGVVGRRRRR